MGRKKLLLLLAVAIVMLAVKYVQVIGISEEAKLRNRAWHVFEQYLEANKKDNLDEVKNLVVKVADVCLNNASTTECSLRMSRAYAAGSSLKRKEFKTVWSDSRQIIMLTDLKRTEGEQLISYNRALIYFLIEEGGSIKMLRFWPQRGVSMPREGRTIEEIDLYLQKVMVDGDMDGMEDEVEQCLGAPPGCTQTDHQNRDTDADGLWDGTEAQFN